MENFGKTQKDWLNDEHMKSILLALLLSVTALQAQVISNLVYSAPGVRIYVVTIFTDTNFMYQPPPTPPINPAITPPIVATNTTVKVNTNSPVYRLEERIKQEEIRIQKFWGDLPVYYAGNSDGETNSSLDRLMVMWEQKNLAVSNLNVLKLQLEQLKKK